MGFFFLGHLIKTMNILCFLILFPLFGVCLCMCSILRMMIKRGHFFIALRVMFCILLTPGCFSAAVIVSFILYYVILSSFTLLLFSWKTFLFIDGFISFFFFKAFRGKSTKKVLNREHCIELSFYLN